MGWHLNLEHGYYSIKIPKSEPLVRIDFGIKNKEKIIELGILNLDLEELLSCDLIEKEGHSYLRVQIYFDSPKFFISKSRKSKNRRYLDIKHIP